MNCLITESFCRKWIPKDYYFCIAFLFISLLKKGHLKIDNEGQTYEFMNIKVA